MNLKVIEIAKGAIVFAVNASVPVTGIAEAQVCDIYIPFPIHCLLKPPRGSFNQSAPMPAS